LVFNDGKTYFNKFYIPAFYWNATNRRGNETYVSEPPRKLGGKLKCAVAVDVQNLKRKNKFF